MKKLIYILLPLSLLFQSCETDFDVIAPYKEVMVIDGLLNAIDTVQYVKVSKAFLGEGNALLMAQQNDSIYYADILDVKLERILNNQVTQTFSLIRNEMVAKDTGVFSNTNHVLYSTNQPILQDGSEYRIRVVNTQSGTEATSRTKIVKDMTVTSPIQQDSIELASPGNTPYIIRFNPGANSKIYDIIVRFNYRELDPSGASVQKKIDWSFSAASLTSNEIVYTFFKYDFFRVIGENLHDLPGYSRRIDSLTGGVRPIELILIAGTEDLKTYIELQKPSSGIVQERPLFTTVENGLGLFTSRIVRRLQRYPTSLTVAAFDTSVSTRNKNFQFN